MEPPFKRKLFIGSCAMSRHFEARQACPRTGLGRKKYWQEHDREALRGSSGLIEACPRAGLVRKTYWHEHDLEALRGPSRLDQEQASEQKRIGTSTISRPFEAHRGLLEARPRRQNALARARHRGRGDPKLYNTIVGVPWHHG